MNKGSQLFNWLGGGSKESFQQGQHRNMTGGILFLVLCLLCFFMTLSFIDYFANLYPAESVNTQFTKSESVNEASNFERDSLITGGSSVNIHAGTEEHFSQAQFLSEHSVGIGLLTGFLATLIIMMLLRLVLSQKNLYHGFQRFLWWCAGARLDFLEQSPSDHAKFFGIGGTIMFTALMATFAGGYAFFTAFDDFFFALLFGLFWGALIFNLDRYIVSSTGKGDGTAKITWTEFTTALPRLALAILIALVISTPLELKIFEKEIGIEIQKIIDEKRQELAQGQDYNLVEIQRIKDEISRLNSLLEVSKEGITDDPRVNIAQEEVGGLSEDIKVLEGNLMKLNNEKNRLRGDISALRQQIDQLEIDHPNRSNLESRRERRERSLSDVLNKIRKLEGEINSIETRIGERQDNIQEVKGENADSYGVKLAQTRNEIERLETQLFNIQNTRRGEIERYEEIARQYTGLMAQMDALARLTERPVFKERRIEESTNNANEELLDQGIPTDSSQSELLALPQGNSRTEYLEVGTEKTPLFYAKWLITLLFICIEIAPILFKMMTESGPYDNLLEAEQQESDARRIKKISDLHMEINNDIHLNTQKYQSNLDVEVSSNKELIQAIARAQNEVAKLAIDDWKKEQLKRVMADPGSFITSTNSENGTVNQND